MDSFYSEPEEFHYKTFRADGVQSLRSTGRYNLRRDIHSMGASRRSYLYKDLLPPSRIYHLPERETYHNVSPDFHIPLVPDRKETRLCAPAGTRFHIEKARYAVSAVPLSSENPYRLLENYQEKQGGCQGLLPRFPLPENRKTPHWDNESNPVHNFLRKN